MNFCNTVYLLTCGKAVLSVCQVTQCAACMYYVAQHAMPVACAQIWLRGHVADCYKLHTDPRAVQCPCVSHPQYPCPCRYYAMPSYQPCYLCSSASKLPSEMCHSIPRPCEWPLQQWGVAWATLPAAVLTHGPQSLANSAQRSPGSSPHGALSERCALPL